MVYILLDTRKKPDSHTNDDTHPSSSGLFLCGSALCVVGIVGNSMNVVVMTRRRVRTALDDRMERSARVGLLSLTIADILPDHFRFRSVGRSVVEIR